jgi:Ca2+:H+ antiporter
MFLYYLIPPQLNRTGLGLIFDSPDQLAVEGHYPGPGAELELYCMQAANLYYYKYSVGGMNVIPVNLLLFVFFTIALGYVPPFNALPVPALGKFFCALISIIPLAYYIGMALSSISAQTTLAVGAVLNATFGSIIELILYFSALYNGYTTLTVAAVTGGLLGNLLLMPGVSMIAGGIKFRNQSFNKVSAGVSSVLIIISIVGIFTPTICYRTFGHYSFDCRNCTAAPDFDTFACQYCLQPQVGSSTLGSASRAAHFPAR